MIPMVDVVMVILIFMMLVGQFGVVEHYLSTTMPMSQNALGGAQAPKMTVPDEPLEIRIDSADAERWVSRIGGRFAAENAIELLGQLRLLRGELLETGLTDERIHVVISPGGGVRYEDVIGVYQAAMEAGFQRISFTRTRP